MGSAIQVFSSPPPGDTAGSNGQYRPETWSVPAETMMTVAAQYAQSLGYAQPQGANAQSTAGAVNQSSAASTPNATPLYFVFDGVMRTSHSQPMTPSEKPVQDSANLTDHIKANQARLSLDVIMSDVLPAYADGQWVGNASKSISCFQTLDNIRLGRIPVTLQTRLKTYNNVFILDVIPDETIKTKFGFRGRIEFKQMFLVSVATQTVSARSQTTDSTSIGQTNPVPVPAGVTTQNALPSTSTGVASSSAIQAQNGTVIGAGNWSSNNTGNLPSSDSIGP
jgi:hypothetical protein